MKQIEITLTINEKLYKLSIKPSKTLLEVLRDELRLTGVKYGCGIGECGACTVLIDGKPKNSCLILAASVDGKTITTIEGVAEDDKLHPLQESFVKHGAVECGYCSPGMILTAKALLDANPQPTEQEVRHYLRGNLCRCTGYAKIVEAVLAAAGEMRGGKHNG
jgi:aerobic-type carbon monoxide dehydrogenase small subunit (CoxS/CutS family)